MILVIFNGCMQPNEIISKFYVHKPQSVGNDEFKYVWLVLRLSFRIKSPSCIKMHPCMIFFKIAKFSSHLKYFTIPVSHKLRSLLFEYETLIKNKQACSEINPGPRNLNHNRVKA